MLVLTHKPFVTVSPGKSVHAQVRSRCSASLGPAGPRHVRLFAKKGHSHASTVRMSSEGVTSLPTDSDTQSTLSQGLPDLPALDGNA